MDSKRRILRRFIGALISLATDLFFLVMAQAEPRQIPGAMDVTFHQNSKNRSHSDNFYVTKEGGLVHWRNYKENEEEPHDGYRYIYEVLPEQKMLSSIPALDSRENARASEKDLDLSDQQ